MPISGIEFHKESTDEWVQAGDRDPTDEDGLRLRGAGHDGTGYLTIMYTDIPGNSWNQNRLNMFTARANQYLEHRTPLTDPSLVDDPAGPNGSDPARPNFFWDGGDLVAKPVVISDVTYSEEAGLNFATTRVR